MATEFQILRGKKSTLIDENGVALIPQDKLVDGFWYLTEDTAEVFVCLDVEGSLKLKKINVTPGTQIWNFNCGTATTVID